MDLLTSLKYFLAVFKGLSPAEWTALIAFLGFIGRFIYTAVKRLNIFSNGSKANDDLIRICTTVRADRASVITFGKAPSMDKIETLVMSQQVEVADKGISLTRKTRLSVECNPTYNTFIRELLDSDEPIIYPPDRLQSAKFYSDFDEVGTKSFIAILLRTPNQIKGFVLVEYVKVHKEVSSEDLRELKKMPARIAKFF